MKLIAGLSILGALVGWCIAVRRHRRIMTREHEELRESIRRGTSQEEANG